MRNFSCRALILSVQPQGETNRSVTIFSEEEGIFTATLYGGPKSKLRSLVSPMNSGVIYIYRDEVKKSMKINDFDVKNYHLTFRESLFKMWSANLAVEILIKSKAAGNSKESWRILNGFLDGMELSSENDSRLGLVRFLWRYLDLLGIKPNTSDCVHCGINFHSGKITEPSLSYRYKFDNLENGFICPDCLTTTPEASYGEKSFSQIFFLSKSALIYLEAVSKLQPKDVRKIIIGEQTLLEMKDLCFTLIENAVGTKLKSIQSGIGIL